MVVLLEQSRKYPFGSVFYLSACMSNELISAVKNYTNLVVNYATLERTVYKSRIISVGIFLRILVIINNAIR